MAERLAGAIDLGGTKILAAVVDSAGNVRAEDRRPTATEDGAEAVLKRLIDALAAAGAQAGIAPSQLAGVGIAAAGPVDAVTGELAAAPNLPGMDGVPVRRRLGERLRLPVLLDNDANAAALGEHEFGAGRGSRHMIFLTVSTGIGAGIIIDGTLYRGATGGAGEIGHMTILEGGALCGCGRRGCLEALASGTAIGREGEAAAKDRRSPLLQQISARGEAITAEHVVRAADAGDAVAADILAVAAAHFGRGLVNVTHLFNPEVIVVGGGVSKIGPRFLEPAITHLRAGAFPTMVANLRVLPAQHVDDAGILGAAALVFRAEAHAP